MAGYLIARVEVTEPEQYSRYTERTPEVIARYGGRFVVRGGPVVTLEGPEEKARIVVIEFPSQDAAVACYRSPEYQAAKRFREGAAVGQFIAVAGYGA